MRKIILQKHYPINVSLFANLAENCWENKICFSGNKGHESRNIFAVETNLPTCFEMFSVVSTNIQMCKQSFKIRTNINNTLRFVQAANDYYKLFLVRPRWET